MQSYDAVPALRVRGPALRRALRTVTTAWMVGVVWLALISGSQLKIFASSMGFNDLAFGVMGSLPFLATLGQLLASLLIQRTGGLLKFQFIECGVIHRLLWLAVAAIPLVAPIPSTAAVLALLGVLTASWFLAALSSPPWITWMGALIPRRIRGRYFANRERLCQLIMGVVVLLVGLLIDRVYDSRASGVQTTALWTICGLFALAALFGAADILLFYRIPEVMPTPRRTDATRGAEGLGAFLRRMLVEPFADRVFRHYVLFSATMTFSMTVAGWYFWRNALEWLGWSPLVTNGLFLVLGPIGGITSARMWGRAIDRWGRRPVLFVSSIGAAACLLPWFFIMPQMGWGGYALAAFACLLGAASWTAVSLAQTGIVLGFADGSGQSRYVAASAVLISLGGVAGGWVGGGVTQLLEGLQKAPLSLWGLQWNNWHVAFLLATLSRLGGIFWLVGMPDPGAASAWYMVRLMGVNAYNVLVSRLFFPLRAFGWRQSAGRRQVMRGRQNKPGPLK